MEPAPTKLKAGGIYIWSKCVEIRKHRSFREVWIAYLLGAIFFFALTWLESGDLRMLHSYSSSSAQNPHVYAQGWLSIQQNIRIYGASLTAFLIVIGLARLACYEKEQRTESLIRVSGEGPLISWCAKVIFTVGYCFAIVFILGFLTLTINGTLIGFQEAHRPVAECVYFISVPLSNILYCIVQYVFLFIGALYFAGFVLLAGIITRRTSFTILICGFAYLVSMVYEYANSIFSAKVGHVLGFFYRFGFGGYLLQRSYCWTEQIGWPGEWKNIWKPILLALAVIIIEFASTWVIWRRKGRK